MSSILSPFKQLPPNVWLLMGAMAFLGAIGPVIVFVGGFIGIQLAPNQTLATLPIALMVVGTALFMMPVVKFISRVGRKRGFQFAIAWGGLNSLFTIFAIYQQSFWLFCFSIILYGVLIASAQQFRFAAMECVDDSKASNAVSAMLIAGLVAAFIGPEIAFVGKNWLAADYAGSFLGITCFFLIAFLLISFYNPPQIVEQNKESAGRNLTTIIKQPVFLIAIVSGTVGFSVMSFIMTATPISMHVHNGFDLESTKWVIQSHIIAMYLPSFITGSLIQKFGHKKIIIAGVLIYATCISIGYFGHEYLHYWGALVLLGLGWNFLFVTATALLPQSYEANERFKVQGFNDLVMFSCQAIASLSAGWVIQQFGWHTMLTICIPMIILVCIAWVHWQRSLRS